MAPLVVTLLRFAFLALMWLLVFFVVMAMRRDLGVNQRTRFSPGASRKAAKESAPPPAAAENPSQDAFAAALNTPPAEAPARATELVVLQGPRAGTHIPLAQSPILLGRAQEATLVLDDDYASGRHARLFPQGRRWFLEDLGSTNGTFVDDAQLTRAVPVELGQRIRIGKTVMELRP